MARNSTCPDKSYRQRYSEWINGACPYCGNDNPKKIEAKKGIHFECIACSAQNFFSNKKVIK